MPIAAIKNGLTSLRRFWRLDINASDNALEKSIEENDRRENVCARALILGLFIEVVFAFWFRDGKTFIRTWTPVIADILVAGGVLGEVHFASKIGLAGSELRRRSTERLTESVKLAAEANERASQADLKRVELEASLQPRETDQRQEALIQTLNGKLDEISIVHNPTFEPIWFANELQKAFFRAGIPRVGLYQLDANKPAIGIAIYDPAIVAGKTSDVCNVLVDVFRGTGSMVGILSGLPSGVSGAPTEYPAIVVGERFPVLPPHIATAMKMADAAYIEMKRREAFGQEKSGNE